MVLESKKIYGIVATASMLVVTSLAGNFGTVPIQPEVVEAEEVAETEEEAKVCTASESLPSAGIYGKPSPAEFEFLLSELEEQSYFDYYTKDDAVDEEDEDSEEVEKSDGISMANVDYVATLIESEAGNVKSTDGRVAIALTAFKRTESSKYPDTLVEVVEQPYQYASLVGYYSDESYDAAVRAIRLWEEGNDDTVLPDGYMYFFGYNRQNWFYRLKSDGSIEIYALPGQTITDDVWQAFRKIVLKEVPAEKAETEVQEAIEAVEAMTEETNETVGETASSSEENVAAEATMETINSDTASEAVSTPNEEAPQEIDTTDASSL